MKIFLLALALQVSGAMSVGGYSDKPVDDETTKMAVFAVPLIQGDINSDMFFKLKSVDKAAHQIVSGKNYKMELTLIETTCKLDAYNPDEAVEHESPENARVVKCTVTVWDQPWTGTRKVTDKQCGEPQSA